MISDTRNVLMTADDPDFDDEIQYKAFPGRCSFKRADHRYRTIRAV